MNIAERRALYVDDDAIIADAVRILTKRSKRTGEVMSNPGTVKTLVRLQMAHLEAEQFRVLFLDVKNRVIANEVLFNGTLTHTSVYPREIVKRAITHNAAACLFVHNHPSGEAEPSEADLLLTRALTQALALFDVRVLDHFIVGNDGVLSFAECGKM